MRIERVPAHDNPGVCVERDHGVRKKSVCVRERCEAGRGVAMPNKERRDAEQVGSPLVLDIVSKRSIISFDKQTIVSYPKCLDNTITITIRR